MPDFQRGWVWDDNRIKALIASIAKTYPVGAVMFLDYGSENIRFKYMHGRITWPYLSLELMSYYKKTFPKNKDCKEIDDEKLASQGYNTFILDGLL